MAQHLKPKQVSIELTAHCRLQTHYSNSTPCLGLLYGAYLDNIIQVTQVLPYPDSSTREQLSHWETSFEAMLPHYADRRKVGWYSKGTLQTLYQELQVCKSYQKHIQFGFFLLMDEKFEGKYRGFRVKKSFINKKVFGTQDLDRVQPFEEIPVRVKTMAESNVTVSPVSCRRSVEETPSKSILEDYFEKLPGLMSVMTRFQVKNDKDQRTVLFDSEFSEVLGAKRTKENYEVGWKQEQTNEEHASDLLDQLF